MEDPVMGRPPVDARPSWAHRVAAESVSRMGGPLLAAEPYVSRRSTHGTKTGLPVLLSATVIFAAAPTVDRSASWDDPSCRMTSLVAGSTPSASSTRAAAQNGVGERFTTVRPSTLPSNNWPRVL